MWYRFIRQRLPKDIPFHLTEYGCILLIYICCIYLLVITLLITEFKTKNDTLGLIIDYIYKPLKVLDEAIKTKLIYYHNKVIAFCVKSKYEAHRIYDEGNHVIIYYSLNIFPRLILVTVLFFDIFYFGKIVYLYKIILLGLLPLLYKYIIYSLKYAKEYYITQFELIVAKVMIPDPENFGFSFHSLREFLDLEINSIVLNDNKPSGTALPNSSYLEQCIADRTIDKIKEIEDKFQQSLDFIGLISVHLEIFDLKHNYNNRIRCMKIGIFSTYLICWSYVLFISLPLLPSNAFEWLWIIQESEEPFSGIIRTFKNL